eukprot:239282-Chlamydomonas_euryale.AAC.2
MASTKNSKARPGDGELRSTRCKRALVGASATWLVQSAPWLVKARPGALPSSCSASWEEALQAPAAPRGCHL